MRFRCPYCRKECDFEEMQMDADLHAIIKMLPSFGPHAGLVAAYTELFGISPLKARRRKWRLLLEEMKRLFDSESFIFSRRAYPITRAGIAEALNLVVHRHWENNLENHNYLKKIMIGISEREAQAAGRQVEKDLRHREAGLMAGGRDGESSSSKNEDSAYPVPEEQVEPPPMKTVPAETLTPEENQRRVKALLEKIG